MADPRVLRHGALTLAVCVPATFSDDEAQAFANEAVLCGTENGWQVCREGDSALAGCPERVRCDRHPENVHILMGA